MRSPCLLLACGFILTACSSKPYINEDAANQFQSLTKNQQAAYWSGVQKQHDTAALEQAGALVFTQGDEHRIILPADRFFVGATPISVDNAQPLYQNIVKLLNTESTSSIRILTYANTGNSQRDYALSQSWATTLLNSIRDAGLTTAIASAQGKGTCQSYPRTSPLNAHVEIIYRTQRLD